MCAYQSRRAVRPRWSVHAGLSTLVRPCCSVHVRPRWSVHAGPSTLVRPCCSVHVRSRWSVHAGPSTAGASTLVRLGHLKKEITLCCRGSLSPREAWRDHLGPQSTVGIVRKDWAAEEAEQLSGNLEGRRFHPRLRLAKRQGVLEQGT